VSSRNKHKPLEGSPGRPQTVSRWLGIVLFLIPLALYAKTKDHSFLRTYDDGSYITENPLVRDGFSLRGVTWAFTEPHSANWHPLTWLSHMLDCQLFGLNAGKHHLVNALLHAIASLLCFRALLAATGARWCSAFVALFFAVHPLRVESVAWVAERKDVLSGVFFFWMLLAYARYARAPSPREMWKVALPLALGLMSKPMLVTGPAVLCLLDLWPLGRVTGERRKGFDWLVEKWPLWLLIGLSSFVTVLAQRAGGAIRTLESISLVERLANTPLAYVEYLTKSVWPSGLAFYYPHPAIAHPGTLSLTNPLVLGASAGLVGITLLFFRLVRTRPWLLVGWLWFLGMLVPVIGLLQVGAHRMANRYAYLPLVGIYILIAWELRARLHARGTALIRAVAAVALLLATGFATRSWLEIDTWRDEETLYRRALAVTEGNWTAHSNLGVLVQERGNQLMAAGKTAAGRKQLEQAREHYEAVLEIAPRQADAHNNLGGLHLTLGASDLAARELDLALRIRPAFLEARLTRGLVHEMLGQYEQAQSHYRQATQDHPEEALAHYKLGDVLYLQGKEDAATRSYLAALRFDPRIPELQIARTACLGIVWAMATRANPDMRDPKRALLLITSFQRARRGKLSSDHVRVLAAVQAANGKTDEALQSIQRAQGLSGAKRQRLEADAAIYRAGKALEK